MRASRFLGLASVLLICLAGACAKRPKHFRSLEVSKASIGNGKPLLGSGEILCNHPSQKGCIDRLNATIQSGLALHYMQSLNLFDPSEAESHHTSFNISIREEPRSGSTPAFFRLSEQAQAQLVHLYASRDAAAVKEFLKLVEGKADNPSPALGPAGKKVEVTFVNAFDLADPWSRLQQVSFFLIPHDPEVRFTETNQTETIMREIDLGTLTQSSSLSASLTGSGAIERTGGIGGAEKTTASVAPTLSAQVSEQLVRKLKEQFNFRAAAIQGEGRIFRLTLRGSVESSIPSMTRQILTLSYDKDSPQKILTLRFEGKPTSEADQRQGSQEETAPLLSWNTRRVYNKWVGAKRATALDCGRKEQEGAVIKTTDYAVCVTPVAFSVARLITNEPGIRTRAFDDDDDVIYQAQLKKLSPIVVDRVKTGYWKILCKSQGTPSQVGFLQAIKGSIGQAEEVRLWTYREADQLVEYLRARLAALKKAQSSSGTASAGNAGGLRIRGWRVGCSPKLLFDPADLKDFEIIE